MDESGRDTGSRVDGSDRDIGHLRAHGRVAPMRKRKRGISHRRHVLHHWAAVLLPRPARRSKDKPKIQSAAAQAPSKPRRPKGQREVPEEV